MVSWVHIGKCGWPTFFSKFAKCFLYYSNFAFLFDWSLKFTIIEVSSTYDYKTFSSIGYTLVGSEWYKNDCMKERSDLPKAIKFVSHHIYAMLKHVEEVKEHLHGIEESLEGLKESISKLVHLGKDTSIDVGRWTLFLIV